MKKIEVVGRVSGVNKSSDGIYYSFISIVNTDEVALTAPIILKGVHVPIDAPVRITLEYVEAH
jgi:hypothetical protein